MYIYKYAVDIFFVEFNAMHKLGSSPIGCEDFSTLSGITSWVATTGYEGSVQPQKGQGEARLN